MPLIHDASLEEKSGLATDGYDGTAEGFLGLLRRGAKVHEPNLEKASWARGPKGRPQMAGRQEEVTLLPQALGSCSRVTGLCF